MNPTVNYMVATGVLGLGLIAGSIFLIRKSNQILQLKKKKRNLLNPKNDDEKLELWTIQQKLTGPAGSIWFVAGGATAGILGALICIIAEIMVYFHGINL